MFNTCTSSINIVIIRTRISIMTGRLTISTGNRRHQNIKGVIGISKVILVVRISRKGRLSMN